MTGLRRKKTSQGLQQTQVHVLVSRSVLQTGKFYRFRCDRVDIFYSRTPVEDPLNKTTGTSVVTFRCRDVIKGLSYHSVVGCGYYDQITVRFVRKFLMAF